MLVGGQKFACSACIKGHRSSTCNHADRPLFEIKKKGRPPSQCARCRERRKTAGIHGRCICDGNEKTSDRASKRVKGPNAKALLAIERAKQQGEVRCHCATGGDCAGGEGCTTAKAPVASTSSSSCCGGATKREVKAADDIAIPPLADAFPFNDRTFLDPSAPEGGPVFHLWGPSMDAPTLPTFDELPAVGVPITPMKRSCCSGRSTSEPPSLPAEDPLFHLWPPSLGPPAYHTSSDLSLSLAGDGIGSDFSLSLADFATAASCEGPCRPPLPDLDPALANILSDPNWLTDLSFLAPSPPPPITSTCACCTSTDPPALPASIAVEATDDVCTSCGPACKCGSRCACAKVADVKLPVNPTNGEIDALLRDFFAQPLPEIAKGNKGKAKEVVEDAGRDTLSVPREKEKGRAGSPSSCCCASPAA